MKIVVDPQTAQGWMQNHRGSWQYRKDGKAVIGRLYDDKKWYWRDKRGWMFHSGWKQIDGKWHYFYADDSMAVNIVIDEDTARVVRDIFRRRIDRDSAERIADELNRLVIPSPLASWPGCKSPFSLAWFCASIALHSFK